MTEIPARDCENATSFTVLYFVQKTSILSIYERKSFDYFNLCPYSYVRMRYI
jgi:hypothetical protein